MLHAWGHLLCRVLPCVARAVVTTLSQLSPDKGWVPMWRAPIMAVVVLLCFLVACLLGAMLISNKLQAWLKVRCWC